MDDSELINRIEESLREGFTPQEVVKALREDGYQDQRISRAVQKAQSDLQSSAPKDQNQQRQTQPASNNQSSQRQKQTQRNQTSQKTNSERDVVPGIDLSGNEYTLKQSLIRNKYSLYQEGNLVLKAKQKLFQLKEDLPFKDPEGNVFMHVKAEKIMDVAGDYTLITEGKEEPIAVLEKNWSFLHHKWKVKDSSSQERLLARISSRGGIDILRFIGGALPYMPNFFRLIPHKYDIESPEGDTIGEIAGRFGIRDVYDITVETRNAPQEAIVAAAVAVDALEGN